MQGREPTRDEVVDFWNFLSSKYKSKIKEKANAKEMQAASWLLDFLGIVDSSKFMSGMSTTIGDTIYVPFEIGKGTNLWQQMIVCVHEHEHVRQYRSEGKISFYARYLFQKAKRALYEAEGYRAGVEMEHWRSGQILDAKTIATALQSYGVSPTDIDFVAKYIAISSKAIDAGAEVSPVVRDAVGWLEKNAPEIRKTSDHFPSNLVIKMPL